jgi:hypothetical protein
MGIKSKIIFIFSVLIEIRDIIKELILEILFIALCNRSNLVSGSDFGLSFINYIFI